MFPHFRHTVYSTALTARHFIPSGIHLAAYQSHTMVCAVIHSTVCMSSIFAARPASRGDEAGDSPTSGSGGVEEDRPGRQL